MPPPRLRHRGWQATACAQHVQHGAGLLAFASGILDSTSFKVDADSQQGKLVVRSLSRKEYSKGNKEACGALENHVQEGIQEKDKCHGQSASEKNPSRIQDAVERRKGSVGPRVLGFGFGWGWVLRPLFLGLLWASLLPVSSSLAVSAKNSSNLDAIKPSPAGLDVDVECHVPPGAAGDASKLEMLRDLDQGPCLQIKEEGVDFSTLCNVTLRSGECLTSCMSLFAWKGYLGSTRPCLHFVAPHVGLPTWALEHVLVDESVWEIHLDTLFDKFQTKFVGLLLFAFSCLLAACWTWAWVKWNYAGFQPEPESVIQHYRKKLRVGSYQLRTTQRRRLKERHRRKIDDGRPVAPLLIRRCRTYGLGRGKFCRMSVARLRCRRQTQLRYCKRMMSKLQGRFCFESCSSRPQGVREQDPILQPVVGLDLRDPSLAALTEDPGTTGEAPSLCRRFVPGFWPESALRFPSCDQVTCLHRDGCFNRHTPSPTRDHADLGGHRHAPASKTTTKGIHSGALLLGILLCLASAVYLFYSQESWNALLGSRIGEASNPGPPGGAERTNRVRVEKILFQSLQDVLAKVDSMASESRSRSPSQSRSQSPGGPRQRSPSPSVARGRSPQRNAGKGTSQESGWKVVQGPKGKGKAKGAPKNNTAEPSPAKEVKFADEDPGGQLLARLKALILECEVKGTKELLPKLRTIVGSKVGAEGPQTRNPSLAAGSGKGTPAPAALNTVSTLSDGHRSDRKGAKDAKTQNPFQWKINQVWWPGKVASPAKFSQTLDLGIQPEADLTVATLAEARQMKELVATHGLNLAAVVVCKDIEKIPADEKNGLVSKYVQLHTGVWKRVTAMPLSNEMPKWGTQLHVVTSEESKACAPAAVKLVALRVTLPQEFLSEEDWSSAMQNPRGLLQACLPAGVCVRAYGWHEVPGKDPAVVGFLQVPESETQNVLSKSGFRGAFFSPLPPKGGVAPQVTPIKWLPREKGVCSGAYLGTAKKDALAEGLSLAYRKGGRSNLGIVGLAPVKLDDSQVRKRWCAKGTPTGNSLFKCWKSQAGESSKMSRRRLDRVESGPSQEPCRRLVSLLAGIFLLAMISKCLCLLGLSLSPNLKDCL